MKEYDFKVGAGRVCSKCKVYKTSKYFWKQRSAKDGLYSCCILCKKNMESTDARKANQRKCKSDWVKRNNRRSLDNWNRWDKKKRAQDPAYKLRRNVKNAILASVKNRSFNSKLKRLKDTIFDHLPYSSVELKVYIESLWEPWMNWSNHGRYNPRRKTWQIDHIIPQSKLPFSLFEDDNFQELWALKNLRPLETVANIKKGNKVAL